MRRRLPAIKRDGGAGGVLCVVCGWLFVRADALPLWSEPVVWLPAAGIGGIARGHNHGLGPAPVGEPGRQMEKPHPRTVVGTICG